MPDIHFTDTEKQLLQHLIAEQKVKTIITKMHIGMQTYYTHCRNIIRKTNKKTITGAVLFAVQNKLV